MSNGFEAGQRWVDECEKHALTCQQIMIEAAAAEDKAATGKKSRAAKRSEAINSLVDDDDTDLRPRFNQDGDSTQLN